MTSLQEPPTLHEEHALLDAGSILVAGLDEVGRGALAGPVSVGAVLVDRSTASAPEGLRDSKLLTARARELLLAPITSWALAVAVGHASAAEVDRKGLTAALGLAGRRALESLGMTPDAVILDGPFDWLTGTGAEAPTTPRVRTLVRADRLCASVAAASIVAKVERDRLLGEMAERHPVYAFERNKGYGSPVHLNALRLHGPCTEHRRSWSLPEKIA